MFVTFSCYLNSAGRGLTVNHTKAGASSASVNSRRDAHQRYPQKSGNAPVAKDRAVNDVGVKPINKAGSDYDDKLVEMINTVIVDRSPSVKWDDVGRNMYHESYL